MAINQIVATVSLVLQFKAGVVLGTATGFFYSRNASSFSSPINMWCAMMRKTLFRIHRGCIFIQILAT
jgi:hypothetical protein